MQTCRSLFFLPSALTHLIQMSAKILKFSDRSAIFSDSLSSNGLKQTGSLLGSFYGNF